MKVPNVLCAAFLLATTLSAAVELAAVTVPPSEYVEGELLVKFADGTFSRQADQANARIGAQVLRAFPACGWQHVRLPSGMTVQMALAAYLALPEVAAAEPNYYFEPAAGSDSPPDDPLLDSQWGLARIAAAHAWKFTTGSPEVVVAVIDSGVRYDHEDLAANMWRNPGEIGLDDSGGDKATNGVDDDNNGYVDDVYGIDPGAGDTDPMDEGVPGIPWGHGTCVAGIVGAVGNNGKGIAGVNWEVRIMALRVFGAGAGFTTSKLLEAFEYVTLMKQRGVNVRVTANSYGVGTSMPHWHR
jgi:thermitase